MPIETCCGAVVINRENGETRYLLIANPSGIWGFPKGHMEAGETERETALREIKEETGLDVQFLGNFRAADEHALLREGRPDVTKQITYFLAEYRKRRRICPLTEREKKTLFPCKSFPHPV